MVQLQDKLEVFDQKLQIVGLSYDSVAVLRRFSDSQEIAFPLLSDKDSATIREFDLHFDKGLPHPATLLIDTDGIIRAKLMNAGYVDRHSVDELLEAANSLE